MAGGMTTQRILPLGRRQRARIIYNPLTSKYVRALRLSASVNNLATITGYSGLTPMINSSVINSSLGIDDKNMIPVYRSYTFSLSIQF